MSSSTHIHPGNPAHRATDQGIVNGMRAWRCSCGDTIFKPLPSALDDEITNWYIERENEARRQDQIERDHWKGVI